MPVYRFPTLLWQDAAGFFTAVPVEADGETAGFGKSPTLALNQLSEYLAWLYKREPDRPAPTLRDAELSTMKVAVRPEYHVDDRIYACLEPLTLTVHYVAGRLVSGLSVAALPLIGVRFYYHESDSLKALVTRYTQQALKGMTPGEVARFLPPPLVRLEAVTVRVRQKTRPVVEQKDWPALTQVAEPLGERTVRKQYAHAWERGPLVAEAVRKLHHERTNLLLVAEPGAGKTTLLVEAVKLAEAMHASEAKIQGEKGAATRLFWLTSAGRLIAGMKYLGQWEERCEQVIDELARVPGVLCVDRLLDLLRLGGSGPGDSLAAFLVPYLQRGELRLVGECSPAELDACRRLLPGFVDLFPILHVPPFDRPQALAVLDRLAERHAQNLRLQIEPGVSDRIYHLFCRFAPYQVFPGPAEPFVRGLCERQARTRRDQLLTPEDAVAQFVRCTGLPDWLLRDEVPLDHDRLLGELRRQVIGQETAVQTAAQLVMTFKAGINDPRRPIGVLLFCGPTGVGKTELARALARVFFGHGETNTTDLEAKKDERLVRLDMSEYAGIDAAERLLGPANGEPGPLIRRLRQQPFCIVLLDEIEKAAPEVFDMLLGVCDEGRLTDCFGRTTTFRSSVIIMTSNLGAELSDTFGFGSGGPPPYVDAARKFFRPEVFNRLDAVVTFEPLSPATIAAITRKELEAIGRREGIQRLGLTLRWGERLLAWLAREGFNARYGARPLQRLLERRVVAELAKFLLAAPALRDALIDVDCTDEGGIRISRSSEGILSG